MERGLTLSEKREIQLKELEVLRYFDGMCRENDLTYFLTAGTLLGAVRHKGFIPWDDDVDVAMPRRDYDRMLECRLQSSDDRFFFQNEKTDRNSPISYTKIRMNGTKVVESVVKNAEMHDGICIDVFPLDICPDDERKAEVFFKLNELFDCVILAKVSKDFACGYTKKYARVLFQLEMLRSKKSLEKRRTKNVCRAAAAGSGKRLCTVSGTHGYPRECYQAEWFSDAVYLPFEGEKFPCPVGWHEILANMYGDYMQEPRDEEKNGHYIQIEER